MWELTDELFDKIEGFEAEAKQAGMSVTQYAIRWTLNHPAVVSAIVGVNRLKRGL